MISLSGSIPGSCLRGEEVNNVFLHLSPVGDSLVFCCILCSRAEALQLDFKLISIEKMGEYVSVSKVRVKKYL